MCALLCSTERASRLIRINSSAYELHEQSAAIPPAQNNKKNLDGNKRNNHASFDVAQTGQIMITIITIKINIKKKKKMITEKKNVRE